MTRVSFLRRRWTFDVIPYLALWHTWPWTLGSRGYISGIDYTQHTLHNMYSMEHCDTHTWIIYHTNTGGTLWPWHLLYIYSMTSTLHTHHGGCVTCVSHTHSEYFLEHMWHILTDVYTTHESVFMWIHYIHNGVYTAHAPWRTCHTCVEQHMQSNNMILAV